LALIDMQYRLPQARCRPNDTLQNRTASRGNIVTQPQDAVA
jgi:hypothetical protein